MMLVPWLALLAGLGAPGAQAFDFLWPTPVYQCASNHLTWSGGQPPFRVVVAPVFQVPFVYNIPSSAYKDGKGAYDISMQMGSGTRYVLFMLDSTGMGSSMTTSMDTVQGYDQSACLSPSAVAQNSTGLPFSFQVFQRDIVQCETTFNMTWTLDTNVTGPYNMTVMSLTQAFLPFDLYVGNTSAFDWQVNLPAGDQFTVMMNSPLGYGRGGVANTYQVNSTNTANTACLDVSPTTTGQPAGATKTGGGNSGEGDQSGSGGNSGGGGGKGVTIGAALGSAVTVAAVALLGVAIWWFRRRKRNRETAVSSGPYSDGDAGGRRQRGRHDPYDLDGPGLLGSADHLGGYSGRSGSGSGSGGISRSGTFNTVPSSDPDRDRDDAWADSPGSQNGGAYPYPLPPAEPWRGAGGGGPASTDSTRSGEYGNPFETPLDGEGDFGARQGYPARSVRERDGRPSYSGTDGTGTQSTAYSGMYTGLDSGSRLGLGARTDRDRDRDRGKFEDESAEAIALATLPSTADARSPPPLVTAQQAGAFRITNAAEGDELPPSSTAGVGVGARQPTRRVPRLREPGMDAQPRFRRHADAGRVDGPDGPGGVIDLPPMYTDIVPADEEGDGSGGVGRSPAVEHPPR